MSRRYTRLVGALYGGQAELDGLPALTRKEKHDSAPFEYQEQMSLARWLDKNNVLFYHCPNGGYRRHEEAAKFKAMGVKAGVPDICVPIARSSHHGLYLELKRTSGGTLSEAQKWWRDELIKQGYAWFEAKGAQEAIAIIKNYLGVQG
jgi:hypothetical protein